MSIKLRMTGKVALWLETAVKETRGLEFSGLGFIKEEKGGLCIYDIKILHVGSEGYTEIDPKKILPLTEREDRQNMRVWFHRHPIGDGIPGAHNWSGLDETTIQQTPLGGIPEIIGWSVSIVRTPLGWVGRLDDHTKRTTVHVPVYPLLPHNYIDEIHEMLPKPKLLAIPIQKKEGAVPMGQTSGSAIKSTTGITTKSTQTKKPAISLTSGELDTTLSEYLLAIKHLIEVEGNAILHFPIVWTDEASNAYPVRFDPMSGKLRGGKFVLDDPPSVICIN